MTLHGLYLLPLTLCVAPCPSFLCPGLSVTRQGGLDLDDLEDLEASEDWVRVDSDPSEGSFSG